MHTEIFELADCLAIADDDIVMYNEDFHTHGEECYVLWLLDRHGIGWWKNNAAKDKRTRYYGMMANGRLVSIGRITDPVTYAANGNVGYAVKPSERGRGYAVQMIRMLTMQCIRNGLGRPTACVDGKNARSIRSFEKAAWVKTGRLYDWTGDRTAIEFAYEKNRIS